ncbi:hypothetical protein EC09BKT24447_1761 [Escherichia coli 09BKT024447]|nr:hypothetical protein EC09BKT24447_1761 [Escherichia coli 09BKT024447]KDX17590.1 hypothetical protein AC45_4791 [Escherichia coli 2-210-07_S3_C3]KDX17693.1 hypothetical protein AC45_4720 [Escherichia coli 2-210-07_S3_C3]
MICVVISTIQSRGGHHDHAITKTPYSWFFCVGLFCRCCADLAGGLNHHYGDAAM